MPTTKTWQEVYSNTLTEAATSLTISGLTGNSDVLYRVRARVVNGYNGTSYQRIKINNDANANYGFQNLVASAAVVSAARATNGTCFYISSTAALNYLAQWDCLLYAKSGFVRTALIENSEEITGTTIGSLKLWGESYADDNSNNDEVTSLVIFSDQAGGLGIGTNLVIERLNL